MSQAKDCEIERSSDDSRSVTEKRAGLLKTSTDIKSVFAKESSVAIALSGPWENVCWILVTRANSSADVIPRKSTSPGAENKVDELSYRDKEASDPSVNLLLVVFKRNFFQIWTAVSPELLTGNTNTVA
jgi:hypothetical protein